MNRRYAPAEFIQSYARDVLRSQGMNPDDSRALAAAVQRLSDWFIARPTEQTPWHEPWTVAAYFAYYLPLNEIRARAVIAEGAALGFFDDLEFAVDFGAGPGTASLALRSQIASLKEFLLVERSPVPTGLLRTHAARAVGESTLSFAETCPSRFPSTWTTGRTLFVASYSLTEGALPALAHHSEAILLIEPSTQADGRRLLELRRQLLNEGFHAWAPCPHQGACPLLEQSPRDWCHDRVHVDRSAELAAIENHLPFRNQTVTFSYLLLRRRPPPAPTWARLVGDALHEKGKTRQMVCRGSQREFLAWLHRWGEPPEFPRGVRVTLPADLENKGPELRPRPGSPPVLVS